jgi:hypothetical protein
MPSIAYQRWTSLRTARLGQVELAHTAVGGSAPGARAARRQLNHSYCVLLAAEFQGFCRELHTEAAAALVAVVPPALRLIVDQEFAWSRQLDRGNANPNTLGIDFGRFGLDLWARVDSLEPRGKLLRRRLEELNAWRNAVAHSDYDPARLGGRINLSIAQVRRWRAACTRCARLLDRVVADHIASLIGARPWT